MHKQVRKIYSGNALKEFHRLGLAPLVISRAMVESHDTQPALVFLRKLSHKQRIWQNRGSLVLHFDGWDDDERPYFEISELVSYFRLLSRQWNYWLWFLSPKVPDNVRMVVTLHADRQLLSTASTQDGAISLELNNVVAGEMGKVLNRLCQDSYQLLCSSGRSAGKSRELTQQALDVWLPILGLSIWDKRG